MSLRAYQVQYWYLDEAFQPYVMTACFTAISPLHADNLFRNYLKLNQIKSIQRHIKIDEITEPKMIAVEKKWVDPG